MFYTDNYINEKYPSHDRDSCDDTNRFNADPDGSGYVRCNALEFQTLEMFREEKSLIALREENFLKSRRKKIYGRDVG
jgi:hypothetical protein